MQGENGFGVCVLFTMLYKNILNEKGSEFFISIQKNRAFMQICPLSSFHCQTIHSSLILVTTISTCYHNDSRGVVLKYAFLKQIKHIGLPFFNTKYPSVLGISYIYLIQKNKSKLYNRLKQTNLHQRTKEKVILFSPHSVSHCQQNMSIGYYHKCLIS